MGDHLYMISGVGTGDTSSSVILHNLHLEVPWGCSREWYIPNWIKSAELPRYQGLLFTNLREKVNRRGCSEQCIYLEGYSSYSSHHYAIFREFLENVKYIKAIPKNICWSPMPACLYRGTLLVLPMPLQAAREKQWDPSRSRRPNVVLQTKYNRGRLTDIRELLSELTSMEALRQASFRELQ